jgi:deoxyribodipyrimidine photolyase-related protein
MAIGIWVLKDQLHQGQAALASAAPGQARVLLVEALTDLLAKPHRQKQVLFWSAQRHFAEELRAAGWTVDLVEAASHGEAVVGWVAAHGITELRLMESADRPIQQAIERLQQTNQLSCGLSWFESNHFLWSKEEFAGWAKGRKQLRMEFFYREGRRRFQVLMEGNEPRGGRWNFDVENRRSPPEDLQGPEPLWFSPDQCTEAVIAKVEALAEIHGLPGQAKPFRWGVNRSQALAVLEHFLATRLAGFGPYQDAMVLGQPTLWHSLISPYLNLGLLEPLEVIKSLESAGLEQAVPLASLEGVIRQILGWREFTYGLYHLFGPSYPQSNSLNANQPLPSFMLSLGNSSMACLDAVLQELAASGYAHHIQRLMVITNLGLMAGWQPAALTAWFSAMFVDAHDWVMQTNVLGMGLWADGGRLASKPYAASGRYINRMGNYCRSCQFDPGQRIGPKACPYTVLYWDFLRRHAERFGSHPRMALMINQLAKIPAAELHQISVTAAALEWNQPCSSAEPSP